MGETEEAWWESGVKKRCNLGLGRDDAAVSENSRAWEMRGGWLFHEVDVSIQSFVSSPILNPLYGL